MTDIPGPHCFFLFEIPQDHQGKENQYQGLNNSNQRGPGEKTKGGAEYQLARGPAQSGSSGQGRTPFGFQGNTAAPAAEQGHQGHGENGGTGKEINFRDPLPRKGIQYRLDDNAPADSAYGADGGGGTGDKQKSRNLQNNPPSFQLKNRLTAYSKGFRPLSRNVLYPHILPPP
jgi:hypothetical protein